MKLTLGNRRPARSTRGGYNLIEVLIGTALLAVVAVTIAGLFSKGRHDIDSAGNMTVAMAAAQHVAEDIDSLSYAQIPSALSADIPVTAQSGIIRFKKIGGVWKLVTESRAYNASFDPAAPLSNTGALQPWNNTVISTVDLVGTTKLADPVRTWLGVDVPATPETSEWLKDVNSLPDGQLEISMTAFFDIDEKNTTHTTGLDSFPLPTAPATGFFSASLNAAELIRFDVTVRWTEGNRQRAVTIPQARTFFEV